MAVTIKECLELQLLEMEMLFSMFPNKGEISLQDKNALTYVQMYLKNIKEGLPPRIEYSISVDIDEPKVRILLGTQGLKKLAAVSLKHRRENSEVKCFVL